jgi:hypothetical protein
VKGIGLVVLVVGVIWAIVALNMDVSVATGYGRVNNIGLMASRQTHLIFAGFLSIAGILLVLFGDKFSLSTIERKCPFCAELISKEATKCKHCGIDVSQIETHNSIAEDVTPSVAHGWFSTKVTIGIVVGIFAVIVLHIVVYRM